MTNGHNMSDAEIASSFDAMWSGDDSARQCLLDGNACWVAQLVLPLAEQSGIPVDDLLGAGMTGLASAIDKYSNRAHRFQPDSNLQGGYAIWWVQMQIMRAAKENGADYNAATNTIAPTT